MAKDNDVVRQDGTINARALFDAIVDASAMTRPDIAAEIRSKAKELAEIRAEIRGFADGWNAAKRAN
tara:strand:+ start:370 stop:570 length:201 start_codon:yes stop_codon:yes gene_type:complete